MADFVRWGGTCHPISTQSYAPACGDRKFTFNLKALGKISLFSRYGLDADYRIDIHSSWKIIQEHQVGGEGLYPPPPGVLSLMSASYR